VVGSRLDLEARLDALFATAPGDFVATRDALVRELRAEERTDEAARLKSLRRPTVAVAAINRAVREHPDRVADFVDLGAHLAALQAGPDGDRDELRNVARERRDLLTDLTLLAAATAERPEAVRPSIAATLDAASLDGDLRDDLLRGRLTQELAPATRFVSADDAPAPRPTPRRAPRRVEPRDELAARRTRAELERARDRVEAANEALQEHGDAATEAAGRLAQAERRIADLEAALAQARAELVDAKRAEREARRAERRAQAEQERVTTALHAAERAVEAEDRGS
jgi:hypothetical protein